MEKRKEVNDRLVKWILNRVQTEYADDVSLVLIYGSYTNGTANSKSDVDCYFIPKTERGYDFSVDFIIDGVGYDIFPMSWERVERIADLRENLSPLVGDVTILYSDSAGSAERFQALQARMKSNLLSEKCARDTAARRCQEAGRLCAALHDSRTASEIRKTAGNIIMTLADAAAVYNHDYYHFGLKKQFEDLRNKFPNVPQDIVNGYQNVIEAVDSDEVRKCAVKLLEDVCTYLGAPVVIEEESSEKDSPAARQIDASLLASLYEEISSTFNKIYVSCEAGDHILAFLSAVCLQRDLDDAKEFGCPAYELLNTFHYKKLHELSETARKAESDFIQLITDKGGHIKRYDSFEQFEAAALSGEF